MFIEQQAGGWDSQMTGSAIRMLIGLAKAMPGHRILTGAGEVSMVRHRKQMGLPRTTESEMGKTKLKGHKHVGQHSGATRAETGQESEPGRWSENH